MTVPPNATKPPSAYRRTLTRIALSKPGTWFYMNLASRIDAPLAKATRGRLTSTMGSFPVLVLTATGARSGVDRTVPLLYFTAEGDERERPYELAKNLYSGYGVYEDRVRGTRQVPVMRLTPA